MDTVASSIESAAPRSVPSRTIFDKVAAALGLVLLSPVFLVAAIAVVINDGFPVMFRHRRVGRWGRPFHLLKFRSMYVGRPGSQITAGGDPRITRVGRVLRRYKIDEMPQLWNVLRGDMSLIGPRPEAPAYVDYDDATWQSVLGVSPGITDLASLIYRDEEQVLAGSEAPERYYREQILPEKLALNLHYMNIRSFGTDVRLLFWTVWYSVFPAYFDKEIVRRRFLAHAARPIDHCN